MNEAFISYSRKDTPFVRKLDARLREEGWEPWVDWEGIPLSADWWAEIEQGIEGADAFVFIISPDSAASEVCRREIDHAKELNKRIVPVVYRDAQNVPDPLPHLNWLFCRETDDFETGAKSLIETVLTDLDWIKAHTRLTIRAIEWEHQNRNGSYLLRGDDRRQAERMLTQIEKEPDLTELQIQYVVTSQQSAIRRRWITFGSIAFGLVVALLLGTIAFISYRASVIEGELKDAEIIARQTAEAARDIAEIEKAAADEARSQERLARMETERAHAETERLSRIIRSGQLGAQAINVAGSHPQRAPILAIEALNVTLKQGEPRVPAAEQALRNVMRQTGGYNLTGHNKRISALAFSPDGRWLATASDDHTARLWDAGNPQAAPVLLPGHTARVMAVAFSPNSQWLATGSEDTTVQLWNVDDPDAGSTVLSQPEDIVRILAFSPDGQWLAAASDNGVIWLWNVNNPNAKPETLVGPGLISALAFSPAGQWLAAASSNDRTTRLWDVNNRETQPIELSGHQSNIFSVAFSPDGQYLATAGQDQTVHLWNIAETLASENTPLPQVLRNHDGAVRTLAFSPDGQWLLTGSEDKTARLWDMATLSNPDIDNTTIEPIILRGHQNSINQVSFSPDGQQFATAGADQIAQIWNISSILANDIDPVILRGHEASVGALAFGPDGLWLATGSDDGTARLWAAVDPEVDSIVLRGHTRLLRDVTFSPDGQWVATAGNDGAARLWDIANPEAESIVLPNQDWPVRSVAFSPDSRWLATSSDDATIRIWDVANPKAEPGILTGHDDRVIATAFSPGGSEQLWLATGGADGTAHLWNVSSLNSGQLPGPVMPIIIRGHDSSVAAVAFSPDGDWLATGSEDDKTRLWDIPTLLQSGSNEPDVQPLVILSGHESKVGDISFSPNGLWLATASDDGLARLWNMAGVIASEQPDPSTISAILRGHEGFVSSVAFSPDSSRLATGGSDRVVRLWDVGDLKAGPIIIRGHKDFVSGLDFSPDGRWLATSSGDETARLWYANVDELMALACVNAGRNLTLTEWEQYFDEPYRPTCPTPGVAQELGQLLHDDKIEQALTFYSAALDLDPEMGSELVQELGRLLHDGKIEQVQNFYARALELNPKLESILVWNDMCWYGSLWEQADKVAKACDTAVAMDSSNGNYYDSRGLNRALLGNFEGSVEDFEFFIAWLKEIDLYQEGAYDREAWLESLQNGENPFDTETLATLRGD